MAKEHDSEFELVLGNRQLLSVFFIVAVLIGVFFTMGYIVGRNSAPGIASADTRKPEKSPESQRPTPTGAPVERPAAAPPAADTGPVGAAAETRQVEQPPAPSQAESGGKPNPQTAAETSKGAPAPEEPAAGQTYLQVAAVSRSEAELLVDVLGRKGFHSLFAPHPEREGLYRVLVGPFADASSIGQARTDLQKAGFKGYDAIVRKY